MKIKPIFNKKDLRAGAHIRAVVNCHGSFWVEYINILGKPYYKYSVGNKYLVVDYDATYKGSVKKTISQNHLADMGINVQRREFTNAVTIPFTSKAWEFLSSIKDLRTFYDVINNRRITDKEFQKETDVHNSYRWHDEQTDKMREAYYNSPITISFANTSENAKIFITDEDPAVAFIRDDRGSAIFLTYNGRSDFDFAMKRINKIEGVIFNEL